MIVFEKSDKKPNTDEFFMVIADVDNIKQTLCAWAVLCPHIDQKEIECHACPVRIAPNIYDTELYTRDEAMTFFKKASKTRDKQ